VIQDALALPKELVSQYYLGSVDAFYVESTIRERRGLDGCKNLVWVVEPL
jgi:hypothetical protein